LGILYAFTLFIEIGDIVGDILYIKTGMEEDKLLNTSQTVLNFMAGFLFIGIVKLVVSTGYFNMHASDNKKYEFDKYMTKIYSIILTFALEGSGKK
jgi:hypothetical protein